MEQSSMEGAWLTAPPTIVGQARATGLDTLARLNALIRTSGCIVTVTIESGEFRVMQLGVAQDATFVQCTLRNNSGKDSIYHVPWYSTFKLYLGERF